MLPTPSPIDLHGVTKTYQTEAGPFLALKDIHLHVTEGEFVAIIGKSGSGKTTLINMITSLDRPTEGGIVVSNAEVETLSENKLAEWRGRMIGVVFQFFQLLPTLTALENVMLPMDFCATPAFGERRACALELLALMEIEDQARKLPSALSGGQQQRVGIARVLATDPPILAADEVLVQAGREVTAGEVIARLQNIEAIQAEVARAEQAFGRAEAEALSTLAAANEAVRLAQYEFDNFDIPSDLRDITISEALVYPHTNLETARDAFEPYKYLAECLERELRLENPDKTKVYRDTAKIYKKRLDDAWADYNKAIQ